MWLQPREEGSRLEDPRYDIHKPADLSARTAGKRTGANGVGFEIGERVTVARAPSIGDENETMTAFLEFLRQGFGRKQMTAGTTGGKDDVARAHAAPPGEATAGAVARGMVRAWGVGDTTPGRLRVRARTKPIPIASASRLDPP